MMKRGDKFLWHGGEARVMAVADGYVMARRSGCAPFLVPLKEAARLPRPSADACLDCGHRHPPEGMCL